MGRADSLVRLTSAPALVGVGNVMVGVAGVGGLVPDVGCHRPDAFTGDVGVG